ncbi:MAG: hypothetical protein IPG45_08280 [Deltaproteobacteria bacterium]|nr:hypothetical protein [Deltaproteobacteria bacterium]
MVDRLPDPEALRARLSFDVQRLGVAALRLGQVDSGLLRLRQNLERRALCLSEEAKHGGPELHGDGRVQLGYAKAQATAELARRATLAQVVGNPGGLSLIAAMAVGRWVSALQALGNQGAPLSVIKGHIDAGRIAHRMLRTLRPKAQLLSGCGQLTAAVVVADFVHPDAAPFVAEQIEEGLYRGRNAPGVDTDEDVLAAASRALRAGAELLEQMADRAEPALGVLLQQAEGVEAEVERRLGGLARGQNVG